MYLTAVVSDHQAMLLLLSYFLRSGVPKILNGADFRGQKARKVAPVRDTEGKGRNSSLGDPYRNSGT